MKERMAACQISEERDVTQVIRSGRVPEELIVSRPEEAHADHSIDAALPDPVRICQSAMAAKSERCCPCYDLAAWHRHMLHRYLSGSQKNMKIRWRRGRQLTASMTIIMAFMTGRTEAERELIRLRRFASRRTTRMTRNALNIRRPFTPEVVSSSSDRMEATTTCGEV